MFKQFRSKNRREEASQTEALPAGVVAPDFRLSSTTSAELSLSSFRGQPVVVVFYPADWSSVCGDQLALYNEVLPLFQDHRAQLLAISVDDLGVHRAFAEDRAFQFPLLADDEPKGAVAQAYNVYNEERGVSKRALFVVDADGIIRWSYVSPPGVNPGAHGILSALEALHN